MHRKKAYNCFDRISIKEYDKGKGMIGVLEHQKP
jgi:hypothetical protein